MRAISFKFSLRSLLGTALFAAFFMLPSISFAQVWQDKGSDITDFWCPVQNTNRAYSGIADCPSNIQAGQACSTRGFCKVNTLGGQNGNSCNINTELYYCPAGQTGCQLQQTSPGGCTQTGNQWDTLSGSNYGDTVQSWGPQATSCFSSCTASGATFCSEQVYQDFQAQTTQYSCWSSNNASTWASHPTTQTKDSDGNILTRTSYSSAAYQPVYSCSAPTYACAATPTATISANPVSITSGQSSALTYSCTNATSATIDNGVGSVSPSGGTVNVSPTATTNYTLTCTGSSGSATASVSVAVTPPPISGSCSVSPTSITTGGSATWTSTASGGTGSYTYSWTGTDGLTGTGSSATGTYNSAGAKTGSVTITSGNLSSTINCSNSLTVNAPAPPPITASCSVSPTSITTGGFATWSANASGGTGTYTYSWTGSDGLSGSASTAGQTYNSAGTKTASVTVTSGGNSATVSCSNNLTVSNPPITGSCSVSPASIATGGSATWAASPSGGTGSYTYSWTGTDGLAGSASSVTGTYNTAGTKTASVVISSGGSSATISCSNSLSVTTAPPPVSGTCSVSPTSITAGGSASWTASPSGGNGTYTYTWTGTDGLGGSTQSVTGTYNSAGTKFGTVVISSAGTSATVNCSNSLAVSAPPSAPTASISANPVSITSGQNSTLTYSCTNATTASINNGVGSVAPSGGSTSVSPTTNTTYTLTCTGAGGSASASATVAVTAPAVSATCSVSPTSITAGGSASWTASPSGGNGTYTYTWTGTDGLGGSTQSVTGTYNSAGTKFGTVTVSSGGNSTTVNCSNSLTVSAPPPQAQPDLTAGGVSPSSATVGTVTLTAAASNIGGAPSGGFPMLFQIQDNFNRDLALINSSYSGALAAGASQSMSASYDFGTANTYNVRACANYNTSWTAITPESDYSNNCGPWTTLTVSDPQPPASPWPVCTLNANGTTKESGKTVNVGDSVTYYGYYGLEPYTWAPSDGSRGMYAGQRSVTRTFSTPGRYAMELDADDGSFDYCPLITVGSSCSNPTVTLTANPTRVRSGASATLTWNASGISTNCVITGPGVNRTVTPSSCTIGPSSLVTPAITAQSIYKISCDNGAATAQTIVNVIPQFQEF